MPIEVTSSAVCSKCGIAYGRRKGYFLVNYGTLYKGVGYLSVCKECINSMYADYSAKCGGDSKKAVRCLCRKLDLYWSDRLYEAVERKSTGQTVAVAYIAKLTSSNYAGKSYDDTLEAEGIGYDAVTASPIQAMEKDTAKPADTGGEDVPIDEEVIAFWGTGYSAEMYNALEQRRSYWMSRFPDDTELDIGTEAIIRQICSLELDINRDRAAGRAIDKNVNALNTLLGSASLKPAQKKNSEDGSLLDTPMGVWLDRWEFKRPLPENEEQKNSLVKYISAWFSGHMSKMFNVKNANTKLYDEEMAKYRVMRPELDNEDDDEILYSILSGSDDDASSSPSEVEDIEDMDDDASEVDFDEQN